MIPKDRDHTIFQNERGETNTEMKRVEATTRGRKWETKTEMKEDAHREDTITEKGWGNAWGGRGETKTELEEERQTTDEENEKQLPEMDNEK